MIRVEADCRLCFVLQAEPGPFSSERVRTKTTTMTSSAPELPSRAREGSPAAALWRGLDYDRLALALLLAALALALATFRDYGVTWDEDVHFAYGYQVVSYYASLFHDRSAQSWMPLAYYGAAFDAATALLAPISPLGPYETRHLLNVLVGLLGVAGCWKLGRALAGPRAGFWAALLLLLMPNYYGHMFNNPKDIPFATATVWGLYYIVRLLPELPRPPLGLTLRLGLAIGLGLGVRVGALLLLCYLALAIALLLAWRAFEQRRPALLWAEGRLLLLRIALPVLAVAYPIMLICWPWAQLDPIGNPLRALAEFSQHPFPYPTLFEGRYYPAPKLPLDYLPVHVLLKLPELVLALLLCGTMLALARLRAWRELAPSRLIGLGLVVFAALFPVLYAVAIHAVLFDGMRHFLFVLPPIACVGGVALDAVARWFDGGDATPRRLTAGALGLYLAFHVGLMVRLHPDQYVYYNALVGGVPGAAGRFKLDYWANSYDEAVHGLVRYLKQRDGGRFAATTYHVAVCGPPGSATYYFPKNLVYESDWRRADFYIAFTKDNCNRSVPGREIYRVERIGTLLSAVLDLRHPQITAAPQIHAAVGTAQTERTMQR